MANLCLTFCILCPNKRPTYSHPVQTTLACEPPKVQIISEYRSSENSRLVSDLRWSLIHELSLNTRAVYQLGPRVQQAPQRSSAHYYVSFNLEQVESHPRTLHLPFRPPNSPLNLPNPLISLTYFTQSVEHWKSPQCSNCNLQPAHGGKFRWLEGVISILYASLHHCNQHIVHADFVNCNQRTTFFALPLIINLSFIDFLAVIRISHVSRSVLL